MTREELLEILTKLPPKTEIYVRQRDDAWPAHPRLFKEHSSSGVVLYLETQAGNHRNFPEGYSGAKEIPLREGEPISLKA